MTIYLLLRNRWILLQSQMVGILCYILYAELLLGSSKTNFLLTSNVFQLPVHYYSSVIKGIYLRSANKTVDLETIARNKNDYDWIKDLKSKIGPG